MGTRAQQLALYVIFQTPIEMVSDSPQAYAGQPAFQFIKDVPTSWNETRVLDGYPGKFVVMARRHGGDWYLGGMTNWTPRTVQVPLTFLGSGSYTAEIYADAADADTNPRHVAISRQVVNAGQTLSLKLASGGGCAIRFTPPEGM
jgi:alpha-glucosidase